MCLLRKLVIYILNFLLDINFFCTRYFCTYSCTFLHHSMIPACIIFLSLGTISAYTFHLIGRLIQICNTESASSSGDDSERVTSLGQLWDREIGESTSYLITLVCFLVCYGTCLAYSIVLGDTFGSLVNSAGVTVRGLDGIVLSLMSY